MKRILRIREVVEITGLSRSSIYRKLSTKQFPEPVRLATQSVGWKEQDLDDWLAALNAASPVPADQAIADA